MSLSVKILMFAVFVFALATPVSLMMDAGTAFSANQISIMQNLTGYNGTELSAGGLLAIPKVALGFFTVGLPGMLSWDYAMLSGDFVYLRLLLTLVISGPIIIALVLGFAFIAGNVFSRFL